MVGGAHRWFSAPSGTAGNAISFTQAMTLDASGNLLVGKTSPTYSASNRSVFEINNTDSSIIALQYGGANGYYLQANSTAAYLWNSANTPWIVATNNTERARITAGGELVVGATSSTFRIASLVASGADRDILQAAVSGASNGFMVRWNHSTTKTHVVITDIPTSSAGLPAGTLYSDGGTIKIA
jgi:hypothetical protein